MAGWCMDSFFKSLSRYTNCWNNIPETDVAINLGEMQNHFWLLRATKNVVCSGQRLHRIKWRLLKTIQWSDMNAKNYQTIYPASRVVVCQQRCSPFNPNKSSERRYASEYFFNVVNFKQSAGYCCSKKLKANSMHFRTFIFMSNWENVWWNLSNQTEMYFSRTRNCFSNACSSTLFKMQRM